MFCKQIYFGVQLSMENSQFQNISVSTSIIHDESYRAFVVIIGSEFFSIANGSIYYSEHLLGSNIVIHNISLTSNQQNIYNKDGLFHFTAEDKANIANMNVIYEYDAAKLCNFSQQFVHPVINVSCDSFDCINPVRLIQSFGELDMKFIDVDMNITYGHYDKEPHEIIQYQYISPGKNPDEVPSFIHNQGIMNIEHLNVKQSIALVLISNSLSLTISHLSVIPLKFDPNNLHSSIIIHQYGFSTLSSVSINNSILIGTNNQIQVNSGTAQLTNSSFLFSSKAIETIQLSELIISNCIIKNNGEYYGPISTGPSDTPGIVIEQSKNIY